jgi:O-methyltransferase
LEFSISGSILSDRVLTAGGGGLMNNPIFARPHHTSKNSPGIKVRFKMKQALIHVFKRLGRSQKKTDKQSVAALHPDMVEAEFWELYHFCKPYTMTSVERMYSLYGSVNYVLSRGLEGDFVECGVWRGGSAMLIAKMLCNRNITNRKIFLYDTFEGMPPPSDMDVTFNGQEADGLLKASVNNKEVSVWCLADLPDVKKNLSSTGFPEANLVFIAGKVEDTLPTNLPTGKIALLRLDTDWYESTKHELNVLFPMLVENGVLIIDDYGHWQGCRKAVDEYFEQSQSPVLMNRIDYTGRMMIKNFS